MISVSVVVILIGLLIFYLGHRAVDSVERGRFDDLGEATSVVWLLGCFVSGLGVMSVLIGLGLLSVSLW